MVFKMPDYMPFKNNVIILKKYLLNKIPLKKIKAHRASKEVQELSHFRCMPQTQVSTLAQHMMS